MNKILHVAITEYLNAVRSKAFIIGIIMLPVFMFGGLLVARLAKDKVDLKVRPFAVLDHSESLYSVIATKVRDRNAHDIFDWSSGTRGRQIRPAFMAEQVHFPIQESARAELLLSERVRKKELLGFVTIGKDVAASD